MLAAGPTILGVTPSLTHDFVSAGTQHLRAAFDADVLGGGEASNYRLQGVGSDALLGTADDVVLPLTASYAANAATLSFAALPEGVYRLTVRDAITDVSGNRLDGDTNGTAGGDWVRDFVVNRLGAGLDPSFDGDGRVTTAIGASVGSAQSAAVQADGKIVLAGYSLNVADFDFALARYTADGQLDTSFDGDGKVLTDLGTAEDRAYGLAIQSDGKIVVVGYSPNGSNLDFAVARYLADGRLDTSFGASGKRFTDFGDSDDRAYSVAIQSDGKIVVAGSFYKQNQWAFAVARYLPDGQLDAGFDGDGMVTTSVGSLFCGGAGVAIQPDGKIVVAGDSDNGGNNDFAVLRYLDDGRLDTGFSDDGAVTTDILGSYDHVNGLTLQPGGEIVVAGYSHNGSNNDFAVARYLADGRLDTSFDGDGKLTTDFGASSDIARSVAVQFDDKIIVAGYSHAGSSNDFVVARYLADGRSDASFDGDGKLTGVLGTPDDVCSSVVVQPDGKIVMAGQSGVLFAAARYGVASVELASAHGLLFGVNRESWNAGQLTGIAGAANGLGRLQVGGMDYVSSTSATLDDGGRTVVTGMQSMIGLNVYREVTVPNAGDEDFARTVDVFTNPTGAPITTTVRIVGNLGSDAATTVFATSDDDTDAETTDQWIGTDDADGSGAPAVIHYIHGLTGLKPASVIVVGDNIEWTYNLTVPAGQTVRLACLTIVGTSRAEAIAAAEALIGVKGLKQQAGAFLTPSEKGSLANFDFNRPTFGGVYDPKLARFYLRNSSTQGPADNTFLFGVPGWEAISGDWNGDGVDTIGAFQRDAAQFYLRNSNDSGIADVSFGYGMPGANWVLVMGDWNGDGVDTIGVYDPATSQFYLRNSNSQGIADLAFGFGVPGGGWTPLVGDWDGDGVDTVGLYDSTTSLFYLRNSFTTGMADVAFAYGMPAYGWLPLVGDWNGDGIETVGMFLPSASTFFLRNANSIGNADVAFGLGYPGCKPIVGDWLGCDSIVQTTGLTEQQTPSPSHAAATDLAFSELNEGLLQANVAIEQDVLGSAVGLRCG